MQPLAIRIQQEITKHTCLVIRMTNWQKESAAKLPQEDGVSASLNLNKLKVRNFEFIDGIRAKAEQRKSGSAKTKENNKNVAALFLNKGKTLEISRFSPDLKPAPKRPRSRVVFHEE